MATKRRRFTAQFKAKVATEALRGERTIQAIAAKHEVHPNQVSGWKRQAQAGLQEVFASATSRGQQRSRGDHSRAARQDRRIDRGARFFIARARELSRPERLQMIDRAHPSSSVSPAVPTARREPLDAVLPSRSGRAPRRWS